MGYLEFVQKMFDGLLEHPLGLVYYTLFLSAWTLCCLPTTPVEIAAGFTWPLGPASLASSIGKTLGSCTAFALSRLLLLPLMARSTQPERGPTRKRLDAFFNHLGGFIRTRPWWTVGLIRAAPLPIALKNYGLGMMDGCPGQVFALMTLAVNVPFSVAWALTGASASSLQEAVQSGGAGSSSGKLVSSVVSALVLFVCLGFAGRYCSDQLALMREEGPMALGSPARAANGDSVAPRQSPRLKVR